MKRLIALFSLITLCSAGDATEGGFLFATFKGERTPMEEQVYFAVSRDGRAWQALNGGAPVLVSGIGEKGVRDPFLIRSPDGGKFYLLATDLSVHLLDHDWPSAVRAGSRSIVIWESDDLLTWSEPRLEPMAPEGSGCAWAPEAIYDEETQNYLVFWASTSQSDDFSKHRMWARRTSDFKTFGDPFIYIEKSTAVIDTNIVKGDAAYYRFTKDEADKNMTMETSQSVAGPWTEMSDSSLASMTGYEGPLCFALDPANEQEATTWCLLLDRYSKGTGYEAFVTQDLASGQFTQDMGFTFPFQFRHGSVIPVSASELARLEQGFAPAD